VLLTPCNIAQVESMQGVEFIGAQSLGSCTSDKAVSGECGVDWDLEHEQLTHSGSGRDLLVRLSKTRCAPKHAQRNTAHHLVKESFLQIILLRTVSTGSDFDISGRGLKLLIDYVPLQCR
jgi:hypothetical protein